MNSDSRAPRRRILVIDESIEDWRQVKDLIADDYDLTHLHTAAEASALTSIDVDCVLLDYQHSGADSLRALREFLRRYPVAIVMSRQSGDKLAVDVLKSGARDFLVKGHMNRPMLTRIIMRELERYDLEKSLKTATENFYELADRVDQVLWLRSNNGAFLYLNPAFESIWGHSREGMTAERWMQLVHPGDRKRVSDELREAMGASEEFIMRYRIVRGDDEVRQIRDGVYPIFDKSGKLLRISGIASDITAEIQEQTDQRLSQKMEAIGQLSAGIAHEINTPTQYVNDNIEFLGGAVTDLLPLLEGFADLLEFASAAQMPEEKVAAYRKLVADADLEFLLEEIPGALEQSRHGISQIKSIVLAMKEFSHPGEDMECVDLNRAIKTTVTVARNEWKYVSTLELDLDPALQPVWCIPSAVNQVVLNMVINAAHAIADKHAADTSILGCISIATRTEDDSVLIEIKDTGVGIKPEYIERIYDPFFTTKEVGRGTGQGLAIAFRIIAERHNGSIDVQSVLGEGTTFTIRLPADAPEDLRSSQRLVIAATG